MWKAVFSPDGAFVATAGGDGTARIFDLSGLMTDVIPTGGSPVRGVAVSPDRRRIATASEDRRARLFVVSVEELEELAERRSIRELTDEERSQYAPLLEGE